MAIKYMILVVSLISVLEKVVHVQTSESSANNETVAPSGNNPINDDYNPFDTIVKAVKEVGDEIAHDAKVLDSGLISNPSKNAYDTVVDAVKTIGDDVRNSILKLFENALAQQHSQQQQQENGK